MASSLRVSLLALTLALSASATAFAGDEGDRRHAARKATPVASYDIPFPCGQVWTGGTRARHSPSRNAVDFNRPQDLGKPVVASASGTVTVAQKKSRSGYGKYVVLDHGNGDSTLYAHLQQVFVHAGARVDHGSLIGAVGASGNVTGAHLHYEQKVGREVVEPQVRRVRYAGGTAPSGNCADVPLAGNLVDGPEAEVAVYRRMGRARFLSPSADPAVPHETRFGNAIDEPLIGDWDGDGRDDVGVWSPRQRVFKLRSAAGVAKIRFGGRGDRPLVGDWDGDGRADVGVYRPSVGRFLLRAASGAVTSVAFGRAGDLPVTGDWDGDGRTDLGVFDQATAAFSLRVVDTAGAATVQWVAFGLPGDLPVTADWDADGRTDLGTWSPATGTFQQRQAPQVTAPARAVVTVPFGTPR